MILNCVGSENDLIFVCVDKHIVATEKFCEKYMCRIFLSHRYSMFDVFYYIFIVQIEHYQIKGLWERHVSNPLVR